MSDIWWQVRVLDRKIHLGRKVIHAVVTLAELGLEFLDRHELDRSNSQAGEMRNLASDIEKRSRLGRQIRREKYTSVQLVKDEIAKRRRYVSCLVPRKIRLADDAIARERSSQLPSKRITLGTRRAVAHHEEFVTIAILHSREKATPMPAFVASQQIRVIGRSAADTSVDAMRLGRPNPEPRASIRKVRTHRCIIGDMFE